MREVDMLQSEKGRLWRGLRVKKIIKFDFLNVYIREITTMITFYTDNYERK